MAVTPEEFLKQADALKEVVEAMRPMFAMVASVKQGFVEQGIGESVSDELALEWYRVVFLPIAVAGVTS